jgi:glyoxylase-like metal-dependent hydrolase (beta-lactamase superfamily II)
LNRGPHRPERCALPGCATPRSVQYSTAAEVPERRAAARCHAGDMTRVELAAHDVIGIRAANSGPFSLSGTNSWIVDRNPAWLVDPGPALEEHIEALTTELEARGGLGGIALTHDHLDHAEAVPALRERFPRAPVGAARGRIDLQLLDGIAFGPLRALATPGHSPDHLAFVTGKIALTGDAVLGQGSVFISPDPGALAGYLDALGRLRELELELLCPGHGPVVDDPAAKLDEYIAHRLERERRLLAALAAGKRTTQELLDYVWADAPDALRLAAAVTLAAHLDKLADERRLPDEVERPEGWVR